MTLNWADNASNERGYAVYRSTDDITYTYVTLTAAGATSYLASGLTPSTTYYWRVYAVSEGGVSAAVSGSQATAAGFGAVSCTGAGGNWSSAAIWSPAFVPSTYDNVTISNGCTVTIDTNATINGLTVGQGASGVLQFEPTTARTLTVSTSVTVAANGTFQSNTAGTQTGHVLSVGADLTNNGALDFSTNSNTAGARIVFTGAANATFGGAGATTDVRAITINKGNSTSSVLELNPSNFTVQGSASDGAGAAFLTLTNGTFKVSGILHGQLPRV